MLGEITGRVRDDVEVLRDPTPGLRGLTGGGTLRGERASPLLLALLLPLLRVETADAGVFGRGGGARAEVDVDDEPLLERGFDGLGGDPELLAREGIATPPKTLFDLGEEGPGAGAGSVGGFIDKRELLVVLAGAEGAAAAKPRGEDDPGALSKLTCWKRASAC